MQIIGPDHRLDAPDSHVHTIDIWYVPGRRHWMVQRLNGAGDPIGPGHRCATRREAMACRADWMRRHPETHLTTPAPRASRAATLGKI